MKFISLLFICLSAILHAEEGMYPLSELHRLDLKSLGFAVSASDIYNPNGKSLVDASVKVGGCSASFISAEGLIITNHHCVFGAIQQVSSVQHDYITNGFVAQNREQEIPAVGLTARIIHSYYDVSKSVLKGISDTTDPIERLKIIERNSKQLEREVETKNPGITAAVAEMFAGKTYVMFLHKTIKDIRLVYVPPRSVGEFGGEQDNWMWPRHTGDFSFVRAYVGPDGNPAEYSTANKPFRPKHHFTINPNGANENDRVFILGYPGKTYRHQPSNYLQYEKDIRLPFIQQRNAWMIAKMEEAGADDPKTALALTARIKSLANVEKNYRGKLKGLNNLPIIENKIKEEQELMKYIDADPNRKNRYGTMLNEFAAIYKEMRDDAQRINLVGSIAGSSTMFTIGQTLLELAGEREKPESERQSAYMEKNLPALRQKLHASLKSYSEEIDKLLLSAILTDAAGLPKHLSIAAVDSMTNIEGLVHSAIAASKLSDTVFIDKALSMSVNELMLTGDPVFKLVRMLDPELKRHKLAERRRTGELNRLLGKLIDIKEEWKKSEFIPDANSTLRLTFGRIRGYSPSDATYYSPISTLRGVIEKTSSDPDYDTPQKIRLLAAKKDYGRYRSKALNDLPVNILYDMDTTGGNSGSPILNAKGELIGINFDRAFEATINDFAWDESYSRSIGVDIRYVLWNVEKIAEAADILREIGIR